MIFPVLLIAAVCSWRTEPAGVWTIVVDGLLFLWTGAAHICAIISSPTDARHSYSIEKVNVIATLPVCCLARRASLATCRALLQQAHIRVTVGDAVITRPCMALLRISIEPIGVIATGIETPWPWHLGLRWR